MKLLQIRFCVIMVLSFNSLQAQLIAPEIKVQDTNGRIGVNTISPSADFHLMGKGNSWAGWFQNTNGADVRLGYKDGHGIFVSSASSGNPYLLSLNSGTTNRFSVYKNGRVGIKDSNPEQDLTVRGDVSIGSSDNNRWVFHMPNDSRRTLFFAPRNGSGWDWARAVEFKYNGDVDIRRNLDVHGSTVRKPGGGSWQALSDQRLKTDISDFELGLGIVEKIRPVTYKYTGEEDTPSDQEYVGVIAQELKALVPFMVGSYTGSDSTEYLTVDPSAFDYIIINAVQEQQLTIRKQQALIEQLQREVEMHKEDEQ